MAELFLVGRMIFGGYFIYNGLNHFLSTVTLAQYAGAKGVPMPELAVIASGALIFAGGLSVLLGWRPQIGALCLVLFLGFVTPIMHNFWTAPDAAARMGDMLHFMKNMALLGGTLLMMGVERPWPYSVEQRRPIAV